MSVAIAVLAFPFKAAHRLIYWTLRFFGHPLQLFPICAAAWFIATELHRDAGAVLLYAPLLFLLSRLLWWAADWMQPRKTWSKRVKVAPKAPKPPQAQVVRVAVSARRPAWRRPARALPAGLQRLLD